MLQGLLVAVLLVRRVAVGPQELLELGAWRS